LAAASKDVDILPPRAGNIESVASVLEKRYCGMSAPVRSQALHRCLRLAAVDFDDRISDTNVGSASPGPFMLNRKMPPPAAAHAKKGPRRVGIGQDEDRYVVNEQIGYLLRVAMQRHKAIFTSMMVDDLTQTQFATLAKLLENGPASQNLLGRLIALDAPTIKGVIDRLEKRGLVASRSDATDMRRRQIMLTSKGQSVAHAAVGIGKAITEATLEPLSKSERETLKSLLRRLA
jgi:DNA-binding MarR family transcriptional regulator